jgi:NAD(P)-dependent dehydrogenase (short-subunit alcohol dehydrogenase family)
MGIPNIAHYCAAKWGLIGLIKSLAREVGAHGITANVVCPTNVDTDMIHNDATYRLFRPDLAHPTREDVVPAFQSLTAMPVPWVESIDVSNAVAFLCSEQARYITGETLSVAAGQNAGNAG